MTDMGLSHDRLLTHSLPRPYLVPIIPAQVGDLPAMRDIIPYHNPQDVGANKRVGSRWDDHWLVEVSGSEGGEIRSGAGLDRLIILQLHLACWGLPSRELLCSPSSATFSEIIAHAELMCPPITGPQLRLTSQGLDDRIHHPIHMPQQPGNGVTLTGRLPGERGLIEALQGGIDHTPVPFQGGFDHIDYRHALSPLLQPTTTYRTPSTPDTPPSAHSLPAFGWERPISRGGCSHSLAPALVDDPTLCSGSRRYLITSSARKRNIGDSVRPRVWAVVRLIISSNFSVRSMGKSPGLAPFRI